MIIIIDFGSQYTQIIARRIREFNILSIVLPFNDLTSIETYSNIEGIILSGSPHSVFDNTPPDNPRIMKIIDKYPTLAICYGAQWLVKKYDSNYISHSETREFGHSTLKIEKSDKIFENISNNSIIWMSHSDTILELPDGFICLAQSSEHENKIITAYKINNRPIYGLQFHPEVSHSQIGQKIFENFLLKICYCQQNWNSCEILDIISREVENKVKSDRVVMAVSGGVDSTVTAVLLNKIIGKQLHCVFINTGLLRLNEEENVRKTFEHFNINLICIDASNNFLNNLKNIDDPETKRKIIGNLFIETFNKEANKIGAEFLAQGTIYPDIIESSPINTIKSHHNVGGLPANMKLKLLEPISYLFKDEVRKIGEKLDIPREILFKHPFPGPGLAIRIIGEITEENIEILQKVDDIFISKLKEHNIYHKIWQAGAIFLPVKSVGIMGDSRTYENVIVLRAVESEDAMTANFSHISFEILGEISAKIINEVKGINRVVYDISNKPPATIEWE